jgi:hypothetical protein
LLDQDGKVPMESTRGVRIAAAVGGVVVAAALAVFAVVHFRTPAAATVQNIEVTASTAPSSTVAAPQSAPVETAPVKAATTVAVEQHAQKPLPSATASALATATASASAHPNTSRQHTGGTGGLATEVP